jgi:hypothetical protein
MKFNSIFGYFGINKNYFSPRRPWRTHEKLMNYLMLPFKSFSNFMVKEQMLFALRVWESLTHWNWRTDLGQIGSIWLSKTASVVLPRWGFCDWGSGKDGLKLGCKNDELMISRALQTVTMVFLSISWQLRRATVKDHKADRGRFILLHLIKPRALPERPARFDRSGENRSTKIAVAENLFERPTSDIERWTSNDTSLQASPAATPDRSLCPFINRQNTLFKIRRWTFDVRRSWSFSCTDASLPTG